MENNATLVITSQENRTAGLSFQVLSFYRPRTLVIYVNDAPELQKIVDPSEFVTIRAAIYLKEGTNIIKLHACERCERPVDIPELKNPDGRCLSLAFQDIKIKLN